MANKITLAQFVTPEESEKYYQMVKDNHEPFGPFHILAMELQPDSFYEDILREP